MSEEVGCMIGMIVLAGSIIGIWIQPIIAIQIVLTGLCAFLWMLCLVGFMES